MSTFQEYVVGTSPVPTWLRGRILPYKKMNGEVGYEYRYRKGHMFFAEELELGDTIVTYGGDVYIQRKNKQ